MTASFFERLEVMNDIMNDIMNDKMNDIINDIINGNNRDITSNSRKSVLTLFEVRL